MRSALAGACIVLLWLFAASAPTAAPGAAHRVIFDTDFALPHNVDKVVAIEDLPKTRVHQVVIGTCNASAGTGNTEPKGEGRLDGNLQRLESERLLGVPNFPDSKAHVTIRPGHVLCLGDNTMNSSDSRMWPVPDFPQERIVGKSGWIFWPLSRRWGRSQH